MTDQREMLAAHLREIRVLTTRIQSEITSAITLLPVGVGVVGAADDGMRCYECGMQFRSAQRLAEHVYVQHDGPEPAHYVEAEAKAVEEETT